MPVTICIANQKGGVGKTTTSINLAAALGRAGQKTLLIDMDPQCNATSGVGSKPVPSHPLVGDRALRHFAVETGFDNLSVLPGSHRFRDIDMLANLNGSQSKNVVDQLQSCTGLYDFVLIDCPPSMGRLTQTALSASDEVLMPIQCEYFAMEGLKQMIQVIRDVMRSRQGHLGFAGILLTMFDETLELTHEVEAEVREFFGEIVFETVIPRDAAVSEAPGHCQPVLNYAPRCRGTRAYLELCREVLEHDQEKTTG